jgi:hypothetical protein
MANYTIAVSWSGKDALSDSDAAKVISGADFNTEFTAVQTAVNTKADLNGSAAEAFSATTASTGANTTQVATTAFVQTALQAIYPVGSIYMNAAVSTNPATLLGFGTWAAYAEGKVPVGKASSGTFDTLNATGGAETDSHTLTLSEIPSHNHSDGSYDRLLLQNGQTTVEAVDSSAGEPNLGSSGVIQAAGGGAAHTHDILQPYIVVYMWKRTA